MPRALSTPLDSFSLKRRLHRHSSLLACAPAHRDPWIRGCEFEIRPRADQSHAVAFRKMLAQRKSGGNAPETCANDDYLCHRYPRLMNGTLLGAPDVAVVEQWNQQQRQRGRHQDTENQRDGETVKNRIVENE